MSGIWIGNIDDFGRDDFGDYYVCHKCAIAGSNYRHFHKKLLYKFDDSWVCENCVKKFEPDKSKHKEIITGDNTLFTHLHNIQGNI